MPSPKCRRGRGLSRFVRDLPEEPLQGKVRHDDVRIPPQVTGIMKELLKTALPLMAAALAATVNQFVDRLFLGHVSDVALEAITPVTVLTAVC